MLHKWGAAQDIGGAWQEMKCSECHTGGLP
jgi:hypothetical protein